jgi:predicted peptidase
MMSVGAGACLAVRVPAFAATEIVHATTATAITQVFGDGIRLTAVAIEYSAPVSGADLTLATFQVDKRTVTGAYTSTSANPTDQADSGRFVVVTLSNDDANAPLAGKTGQPQGGSMPPNRGPGKNGVGKAGDIPREDTIYRRAQATISQSGPLAAANGTVVPALSPPLVTTHIRNLIVDDFTALQFHDSKTGKTLRYNLFVPKDYDATQSYPLVLFMHDAGATGTQPRNTLYQGLGAVVWASPEDQAKRPCFVLAPQYAEIIADDDSNTSSALDTTIDLVNALTRQYNIDRDRLYVTGQSGGCMLAIAMDIKYPDFFAASFLVAGQWGPELTKPIARQKLWILVSQDDPGAFPGENAITAVLEREGAKISRATWDGTWTTQQFRSAFDTIDREGTQINYVTFEEGTVIPPGQTTAGASGHRNTWRIAYTIEPIREWVFRQYK